MKEGQLSLASKIINSQVLNRLVREYIDGERSAEDTVKLLNEELAQDPVARVSPAGVPSGRPPAFLQLSAVELSWTGDCHGDDLQQRHGGRSKRKPGTLAKEEARLASIMLGPTF